MAQAKFPQESIKLQLFHYHTPVLKPVFHYDTPVLKDVAAGPMGFPDHQATINEPSWLHSRRIHGFLKWLQTGCRDRNGLAFDAGPSSLSPSSEEFPHDSTHFAATYRV